MTIEPHLLAIAESARKLLDDGVPPLQVVEILLSSGLSQDEVGKILEALTPKR